MQRGHGLLADDVVAIDAEARALRRACRASRSCWQDAAGSPLGRHGLPGSRPPDPRQVQPPDDRGRRRRAPCRWAGSTCSSRIARTRSISRRCAASRPSSSCSKGLTGRGSRARCSPLPEHLALCGRMAEQVRIARVKRPEAGFELARLVDAALLADARRPRAALEHGGDLLARVLPQVRQYLDARLSQQRSTRGDGNTWSTSISTTATTLLYVTRSAGSRPGIPHRRPDTRGNRS